MKWEILQATRSKLSLLWIDIKYGILDWILKKTWRVRLKHSKRVKLSSMAYHSDTMTWDDVNVADQWGHWLPLGYGICSFKLWEFDNKINKDIGEPEEPWQDVVESEDWITYYYRDDYLDSKHYFHSARKHLLKKLGKDFYDKEIELKLFVQSQKSLDDDTKQYLEWIANGSKPFKVELTDHAKEDVKRLFGEDEANDFLKRVDERNKDIDDKKE